MQISYLIPSLYSLGREGDSNNSTSRQLHKSLKNPCNSDAISGMPRIMQRLIICSAFRCRCTDIASYLTSSSAVLYFFCTLQRTVTGFLLTLGPFVSKNMQYLGRNQTHVQHHSLTVPNLVRHIQTLPVLAPQQPFQESPQRTPSPNSDRSQVRLKPFVTSCVKTPSPISSLLSPSETPKGLHHKGVFSGHSSSQLRTSEFL